MAKVKHLLLAKEQEVEEKTHHLKAATAEIENLKTEVSRLRRYEDELNNVQVVDEQNSVVYCPGFSREDRSSSGELKHEAALKLGREARGPHPVAGVYFGAIRVESYCVLHDGTEGLKEDILNSCFGDPFNQIEEIKVRTVEGG
ncbi:uncharacterized protein [Temnothorax nylanderi]|uniref:uncharacterized protein n=1 Tax=Temnothorax nylanderi TaxID=102681 RepID=UPI003A84BB4E